MSLISVLRKEKIYSAIAGENVKSPIATTREEKFLKQILEAINEMREAPLFDFKGTVATTSLLPLTENKKGDVWIVSSDSSEWVWMSDDSSGSLSDYEKLGAVVDLSGYQLKITATGILKGDGSGNVSVAVAGTDFSNIMPGDPYAGVDLVVKFADEIANYTDEWAWIKARIQAGNFSGIHVADYIPVVANGDTYKARIMGINTYKGYGDTEIGNHIDFITEELWPTTKAINPVNWNNGLIPVENVATDGATTEFTLTKEMTSINNITLGSKGLTGWTYDPATFKLTFEEAPAAGTMVVNGNGTEHPWLACDLYHWLNSLAGQVPNSTDMPPGTAVKYVDYTAGGVYYHLPQALKNAIVEKRFYLEKRYSASGKLSSSNSGAWTNIGKLWLPTEIEVHGTSNLGGNGYSTMGSINQYPIFALNNNRVKKASGSRYTWWLLVPNGSNATSWCNVYSNGYAYSNYTANAYRVPLCFRVA